MSPSILLLRVVGGHRPASRQCGAAHRIGLLRLGLSSLRNVLIGEVTPIPIRIHEKGTGLSQDSSGKDYDLTPRQLEVLRLVAEGLADREIARRFGVTPSAIDQHVRAILAKLGATSRTGAAVKAFREGLID
jgi:DNA-binding NarL/FixJ family response regulator